MYCDIKVLTKWCVRTHAVNVIKRHFRMVKWQNTEVMWVCAVFVIKRQLRSEGTPRYDRCRQCEKEFNTNYEVKKHHIRTHASPCCFCDLTQITMWRITKWQYIRDLWLQSDQTPLHMQRMWLMTNYKRKSNYQQNRCAWRYIGRLQRDTLLSMERLYMKVSLQ